MFPEANFYLFFFFFCRIYKEQLEKWEEEIKELRLLDASNEEIKAVLQNAKCLFQNVRDDS